MNKGIVMSTDSEYAYIFTDNCQLVKVAWEPRYQIGAEVSVPVAKTQPESAAPSGIFESITAKSRKKHILRTSAVAAAVLLFTISAVLAILFMRPATVFATVSVDINPSINLEVDRNLNVIEAIAIDQESAEMLAEIELKQLALPDAITKWINYLIEDRNVISDDILIAGVINRQNTNLAQQLMLLESELSGRFRSEEQIRVRVIFSYDEQLEERAEGNSLSIGRQLIYENAGSSGSGFNLTNAAQNRIGQMIDEYVENNDRDWTNSKHGSSNKPAAADSATSKQETAVTSANSNGNNSPKTDSTGSNTTKSSHNSSQEPQGTTWQHTEQNQLKPTETADNVSSPSKYGTTISSENASVENQIENTTVETSFSRSMPGRQITG